MLVVLTSRAAPASAPSRSSQSMGVDARAELGGELLRALERAVEEADFLHAFADEAGENGARRAARAQHDGGA